MTHQIALFPMTLSDLLGDATISGHLQCDFSYMYSYVYGR